MFGQKVRSGQTKIIQCNHDNLHSAYYQDIKRSGFIMTKIDIISGFLGAGKTTFIKKMIDEVFKGEKIVLRRDLKQKIDTHFISPLLNKA